MLDPEIIFTNSGLPLSSPELFSLDQLVVLIVQLAALLPGSVLLLLLTLFPGGASAHILSQKALSELFLCIICFGVFWSHFHLGAVDAKIIYIITSVSPGISRLQRWERAKLHGLNPPEEIRDMLLKTHTDPQYNLRLKIILSFIIECKCMQTHLLTLCHRERNDTAAVLLNFDPCKLICLCAALRENSSVKDQVHTVG